MRSAEKQQGKGKNKPSTAERAARFMRNVNALGAVAFAGAALLVPPAAVAFNTLAALDVVQAGGFEVARRWAANKNAKKTRRA